MKKYLSLIVFFLPVVMVHGEVTDSLIGTWIHIENERTKTVTPEFKQRYFNFFADGSFQQLECLETKQLDGTSNSVLDTIVYEGTYTHKANNLVLSMYRRFYRNQPLGTYSYKASYTFTGYFSQGITLTGYSKDDVNNTIPFSYGDLKATASIPKVSYPIFSLPKAITIQSVNELNTMLLGSWELQKTVTHGKITKQEPGFTIVSFYNDGITQERRILKQKEQRIADTSFYEQTYSLQMIDGNCNLIKQAKKGIHRQFVNTVFDEIPNTSYIFSINTNELVVYSVSNAIITELTYKRSNTLPELVPASNWCQDLSAYFYLQSTKDSNKQISLDKESTFTFYSNEQIEGQPKITYELTGLLLQKNDSVLFIKTHHSNYEVTFNDEETNTYDYKFAHDTIIAINYKNVTCKIETNKPRVLDNDFLSTCSAISLLGGITTTLLISPLISMNYKSPLQLNDHRYFTTAGIGLIATAVGIIGLKLFNEKTANYSLSPSKDKCKEEVWTLKLKPHFSSITSD